MRILLVEPYYSGSHAAWADGWVKHSVHDIRLLTHEAEFWRWRMRGAAVTLAAEIAADIDANGQPDLLVVSDMIDLASLLGFVRSSLAPTVPAVLYMHENQLLYPLGPAQQADPALGLVNWRSLVAANKVWFNSAYQRDVLLAELPRFLGSMPDRRHGHLIDSVAERSRVQHVGVESAALIDAPREWSSEPAGPLIVWNQRWDHDKNPGAVFRTLTRLADEGVAFRLALAGENQRVDPQEFVWVQEQLAERIHSVGHLPAAEYRNLLLRSDVVVSAADHEFFGISIVEAIAAGAVPLLPNRLSYPEIVPREWHEAVLYTGGDLGARLREVLADIEASRHAVAGLREAMRRYDWGTLAPAYDAAASATAYPSC